MVILGKWAILDIETTGINPSEDAVIDIGFLQFEGTKLVRSYSSLVHYEHKLSEFLKKLTGIDEAMLGRAPAWTKVEPELLSLAEHQLVAHNASFEKSFLAKYFEQGPSSEVARESYEDSLLFLALLFPEKSSLNLESFIQQFSLREKEVHRGLEDSLDLLKVLLLAVSLVHKDPEKRLFLQTLFKRHALENYFYAQFLSLSANELEELAQQIDFNLPKALEDYQKKAQETAKTEQGKATSATSRPFALEFSGQNIQNILRSEDYAKETLGHYQYRKSQEELALKTGQSFKNNVHALIQAPTGTGKTLGYLLPGALFALSEGQQVLVATGTKTLQNQAITKDVPALRKLLGLNEEELRVSLLVGSGNHLCELLFRKDHEGEDLFHANKSFEEAYGELYFDMVFFHNSRASYDKQITRGDVPYVLRSSLNSVGELEKSLAVDFRACIGGSCPYRGSCSYIWGLRKAKEAHVVVGNHALMFTWPKGTPRPSYVVVDEAHRIEREATQAFAKQVSGEALVSLAKNLTHLQGVGALFFLLGQKESDREKNGALIKEIREEVLQKAAILTDHLKDLPQTVEIYFKKRPRYTSQYWNELPMVKKENADSLGTSIFNHLESIYFVLFDLYQKLAPLHGMFELSTLKTENEATAHARLSSFMGILEDLCEALDFSLKGHPDYEHTLNYLEGQGFVVQSHPIDVGKKVHDGLLASSSSVVFTSATLANADGGTGTAGMEWATGYTYLKAEKRFKKGLFLPAVFDYQNKCRVFLCDDVPSLYDSGFVKKTMEEIVPLVKRLGGRSLILFSARNRFEEAREILISELDNEIPVFVQGMGNNVVEEFKAAQAGVLLGMESFGEGIDIPGEALQFVFVDKIPDMRMEMVITKRREFYDRAFGNEFNDYFLAHRARGLHQKLGRLLRRDTDSGGAIIVDSRVKQWKGKTQETFLKLMEPYKVQRTSLKEACSQVEKFINLSQ